MRLNHKNYDFHLAGTLSLSSSWPASSEDGATHCVRDTNVARVWQQPANCRQQRIKAQQS
jgi:hypothetical protein